MPRKRLLKRFAQGQRCLARIEAFSDDVFVIVVTLLFIVLYAYIPGATAEA